jgi:N-acyl-phosphatidylethanolamine-hydrolysing phospholipase D
MARKLSLFISSLLVVLTACASNINQLVSDAPAHYDKELFQNPYLENFEKNFFSYLKMRWFSGVDHADQRKDAHKVAISKTTTDQLQADFSIPQVTWLGHSTFLIQYQNKTILTDPILSNRASPVPFAGPERLTAKPITLQDLPSIDVVVISHDHYDHLDKKTIQQLGNQPLYLVPLKLKHWFIGLGIDPERVIELDWWQTHTVKGMVITATPSQHWSGRGLFDRMETLWAAWHIQFDDFSAWFAGDTGYNAHQFTEVGEKWQGVDLALIPIGGYAPRWFMQPVHIDPSEAIRIHNDVKSRFSIGMHWGTFQMTSEPMMEPKQLLDQALSQEPLQQGQFVTFAIGETRQLQPAAP